MTGKGVRSFSCGDEVPWCRTRTSQRWVENCLRPCGGAWVSTLPPSCSTTAEAEDSRRGATASAAPASGEALTSRRQQVRGGDRHVLCPHGHDRGARAGSRGSPAPDASRSSRRYLPGRGAERRATSRTGPIASSLRPGRRRGHDLGLPECHRHAWLATIAERAATTVLMVSLLPMAVFYTSLFVFGLRTAVLTTLGGYYAGLLLKVVRRKPVPAAAMVGAGRVSIRTLVTFLTGSALLYFLQPVAGTVATATVFAATALAGRPVLDRLAHQFCSFPADMSARLRQARFFSRLSVVWSITYSSTRPAQCGC